MKLMLQGTQGTLPSCSYTEAGNKWTAARDGASLEILADGHHTETDVSPQQVFELIQYLISEDILLYLATQIHKIPFEARKDTQFIFSNAFRYKSPNAQASEPIALHHVLQHRPQIIIALAKGYEK